MRDEAHEEPGSKPAASAPAAPAQAKPRSSRSGTWLILVALVAGVALGGFFPQDRYPQIYELFHFLSKAFIALIKGLIVPLLVSTLVVGVAQTGDLKAVGRMGGKSLLYFEVVTTIALGLGLVVANTLQPGRGLPIDLSSHGVDKSKAQSGWDTAMHLFPSNLAKHAVDGDILPIVVFAVLFGIALTQLGERKKVVLELAETVAQAMFKYTAMIMKLTPLGVFGAMAYNVSHMAAGHTLESGARIEGWPAVLYLVWRYARVVGSLYLSMALLVVLVFVPILLVVRVSPRRFFGAIREPLLTAYTTASSEAALPQLLEVLVKLGVPRRVASFVLPAGYSFNLDGSTLYLVLASLTIAQAAGIDMPLGRQLFMVLTFVITSKGVAGVPRATLVIIAATCASYGLPGEAGVAMLLAVDEIMDMARSATNVAGNALATVVVARWEGVFETELEPELAEARATDAAIANTPP
ncbi:MAG TPA: dicarboxylate/amino acid:cation symporter [Polyangiaceae bacterium]|jgi:Na+/H+-dicarboxylate symporter|nr:dicarboxylate/amino acid:cation symporter [Polyangiaceae bacterium]